MKKFYHLDAQTASKQLLKIGANIDTDVIAKLSKFRY